MRTLVHIRYRASARSCLTSLTSFSANLHNFYVVRDYVSARDNATAFLVVWGTADDIVDCRSQSEAFLETLKQARFFVRPVVLPGAPHFWCADPIEEVGSHTGFLAPRLLRFLQTRL